MTWTVIWRSGATSGLDEETAVRLQRVLTREFGMAVERRRDDDPVLAFRAKVRIPPPRIDTELVEQVREGLHIQPPFPRMTEET